MYKLFVFESTTKSNQSNQCGAEQPNGQGRAKSYKGYLPPARQREVSEASPAAQEYLTVRQPLVSLAGFTLALARRRAIAALLQGPLSPDQCPIKPGNSHYQRPVRTGREQSGSRRQDGPVCRPRPLTATTFLLCSYPFQPHV